MKELVSIIMPSYNSTYISESIESVLAQSYENWELLITDDCSTDNTREVVAEYVAKDTRIKLFKLDQNSGAAAARNNSIEQAQGRLIAFLDSDDLWLPEKLEKQVAFMLDNNYEFTFSSRYLMNEAGVRKYHIRCKKKISFRSMVIICNVACATAMYDTKNIGKILMPNLRKRQDWALWLLIVQECKYAYGLDIPLSEYRMRQDSISSKKTSLVKYNLKVYREVLKYSLVKSYLIFYLLYMPNYALKKLNMIMSTYK